MVATLAQAASAEYYLESQRSFRHPNEYYTAGEEPDGVWFNPKGLLGLENGGKVDSRRLPAALQRLRAGRLQQAHQERRQRPALAGRGHDLLGRQERVCALGRRRSRAAVPDRGWRTTTPRGWRWKRRCSGTARIHGSGTGKGRSGSCLPISRWRCSSTAPAGRTIRSFIPTASSSTRPARARTASGGPCTSTRSTAGPRQRARLPQRLYGLEPARAPRRADGAVRPQRRVHPHRGHAGRPAGRSGRSGARPSSPRPESWAFRRSATPRAWPASTSSRGLANRTTTTPRSGIGAGWEESSGPSSSEKS